MRLRRLYTLSAATLIAPVLVVLPAQGEPTPRPVGTTQQAAALIDPADPAVGDGDYATPGDIAVAKSTTPQVARKRLAVLGATGRQAVDPDLAVIGVTWDGATPLAVQYRTEGPAGWSGWETVDTDSDGDGAEASTSHRARSGSDPIVLTGVTGVQARILGAEGDTPRDPVLSVVDPGHGPADENTGATPDAADAAASRPRIRSRAEWGADESLRKGSPAYGVVEGAIVHHTAGTNNYSPGQVPAILRGIYAFHVKDRGWSDIGYNFLVDKWGRIWEGRYGGTTRPLIGAQAEGFNSVTFGVSVMGDYRKVQPSRASIDAVTRIIAWKASLHHFSPLGRFSWKGKTYRNVSGHRDVGQTTCPGLIYNYLPSVAARAASLKGSSSRGRPAQAGSRTPAVGTPPAGGLNPADAMILGTTGKLFAVSPTGSAGISYARLVDGRNWRGYDPILATQDVTGDRAPDLLTLNRRDGRLYVHPGSGRGVAARRSLGSGWNAMAHVVAPGDWNGDGRADLLSVRRSDGRLFLHAGQGSGRFASRVQVGQGWGVFSHVLAVGDWSGDAKPDLVGISRSGRAYLLRGNGRGGFAVRPKSDLGSVRGYSAYVGLTGAGRVLAVRPDGSAAVLRPSGRSIATTAVAPTFRGLRVFGS